MRVRLRNRDHVVEVTAFFRARGFLVVERTATDLDVDPLNHVSARSDAIQVSEVLDEWRSARPDVVVDEVA